MKKTAVMLLMALTVRGTAEAQVQIRVADSERATYS
jgi:hypothetical protein